AGTRVPATADADPVYDPRAVPQRSTRAGTRVPATDRGVDDERWFMSSALNQGRGSRPGNWPSTRGGRRHEQRSTRAGTRVPATASVPAPSRSACTPALNEGRDSRPGNGG